MRKSLDGESWKLHKVREKARETETEKNDRNTENKKENIVPMRKKQVERYSALDLNTVHLSHKFYISFC